MSSSTSTPLSRRELRLAVQLESRGERALFDAMLRLRGQRVGRRFVLESLYAVGGEGVILLARDTANPDADRRIAKVALLPWHKPVLLTSRLLRSRRAALESEARLLERCGSPFLPQFVGLLQLDDGLLESERGGAFAEPEPVLVMERVGGFDLDAWLCRIHRGHIPKDKVRATLDRLCVGVVQALVDLSRRGYVYADLRPGNIRVVGRPQRRARFLDAGACVREDDADGRFPHVPSYLPPETFREINDGGKPRPTRTTQAVMAGRTLYEIATGRTPQAGRHLDSLRLLRSPVSPPIAEVVAALADGSLGSCEAALESLVARARRRVPGQ